MFKYFEKIAKNNKNIALVYNDKKYQYNELLSRVNENSLHFDFENKAAIIYLPKNEYQIIFQLSLNKTNNIFTPVDINTPIDRLYEIILQLKPEWIITTPQNEVFFKEYIKIISDDKFIILKNKLSNSKIYNNEVSHIYFSSGSTGKPKGIMLKPKPLIDVVLQQASLINMKVGKRFAWLLSPSFDASLSDIYLTLFSGGELHVCDFPQNKIKTLIKYLKTNNITHSDISPSVLPFIKIEDLSLESIIFGGEIGNEEIIKKISKKVNMFNAYGPTETTICSSLKKVDDNWEVKNIGIPLKNVFYEIADNNELYIYGENVCAGYIDDDLNKIKFFKKNNKIYFKTGDLVKFVNNEYYYLGRLDRQFKHNGILISPEEVESIAKKCGSIEARCDNKDKYTLYYQGDITPDVLRKNMENYLNKNMLPQSIININKFNTNINGKIIL